MELETNLFDSLRKTLTGSPKDWSLLSEDIWLWGIIVGWHEPCYKEFEKNFSWWTKEDTERLKNIHSQFVKIAQENGSKLCID